MKMGWNHIKRKKLKRELSKKRWKNANMLNHRFIGYLRDGHNGTEYNPIWITNTGNT